MVWCNVVWCGVVLCDVGVVWYDVVVYPTWTLSFTITFVSINFLLLKFNTCANIIFLLFLSQYCDFLLIIIAHLDSCFRRYCSCSGRTYLL